MNRSTLKLETVQSRGIFIKAFDPMLYPEYRQYKTVCDTVAEIISCGQRGMVWTDSRSANPAPVSAASVAAKACSDRALELHAMRTGNQPADTWKCDACGRRFDADDL